MSANSRTLAGCLLALAVAASAATNSAVITLTMPVGARQLGMGETSFGLADDVFATYWNPAGLAFGPLADEWDVALTQDRLPGPVTAMAAVPRGSLFSRGELWVASGRDLRRWNGKSWMRRQIVSLEQGDQVEAVARRFFGNLWPLDKDTQQALLAQVREASGAKSPEDDASLNELVVPFELVVQAPIRALVVDETGKLWVGTDEGLLRFDGRAWKLWDESTGLPDRRVTSLAASGAVVWVGTRNGLVRARQKGDEYEFRRFGQEFGLGSQEIAGLAVEKKSRTLWVATADAGVSRLEISREASTWRPWTSADGLLSDTATGLCLDPDGGAWIAHPGGVSHWDGKSWERLDFQGVTVRSVAVDKHRNVWIATDKGAWKYYSRAARKAASGGKADGDPDGEWLHFHSGNGLSANEASLVVVQGDEVDFATPAGIVRYTKAQAQVGFFYETLLPKLNIKDLFHTFVAGSFPVEEWGTFGGYVNFLSLGENSITDETTEEEQTFTSYELVGALSYGTRLNRDWGLGVNLKFIYSALAPGYTEAGSSSDGTAASYAFDVSALRKNLLLDGLSLGMGVHNIGPSVFYIDQDKSDPIPMTWKLGLAYRLFERNGHKLTAAADFSRETISYDTDGRARNLLEGIWFGVTEPWGEDDTLSRSWNEVAWKNLRESNYNVGLEYVYSNLLALRSGLLLDPGGHRQELDLGVGVSISDLLQFDYAYIQDAPWVGGDQAGVREGQSRFSMNFLF